MFTLYGLVLYSVVPVLDELVKAIPCVVVLMHFKIVVEGLINGFDGRSHMMTYNISNAFFHLDLTEKKETTTSILFALISLLHWTLSLA